MPCRAMAETTVNEAVSSSTPSGMRAQRLAGTLTTSAWLPLLTTRSPTRKPATSGPVSITTPAFE